MTSSSLSSMSVVTADAALRAAIVKLASTADPILGVLVRRIGFDDVGSLIMSPVANHGLWSRIRSALDEAGFAELDDTFLHQELQTWRESFAHTDALKAAAHDIAHMQKLGAVLITHESQQWPQSLELLGPFDMPVGLWVKNGQGRDLSEVLNNSITVTGMRACTDYGHCMADELTQGILRKGVNTVSTIGFGIDVTVQRTAMAVVHHTDTYATTVAVLPTGIDMAYPSAHSSLLDNLGESAGIVISAQSPGSHATRQAFLRTGRLMAAISRATIVVESGPRGGALATANAAHAIGRPLGAVPGPVTSLASVGCHQLIHEGRAVLISDAEQAVGLLDPRSDQI